MTERHQDIKTSPPSPATLRAIGAGTLGFLLVIESVIGLRPPVISSAALPSEGSSGSPAGEVVPNVPTSTPVTKDNCTPCLDWGEAFFSICPPPSGIGPGPVIECDPPKIPPPLDSDPTMSKCTEWTQGTGTYFSTGPSPSGIGPGRVVECIPPKPKVQRPKSKFGPGQIHLPLIRR